MKGGVQDTTKNQSEMTPQRIQRKRTKGWKMPENTVNVTRPGKWGNFLKLSGDMIMIDAGHRRQRLDKWVFLCFGDIDKLLEVYKWAVTSGNLNWAKMEAIGVGKEFFTDLLTWHYRLAYSLKDDLKGKNLACFCKEGQPCHAEILLKIANQ